LLSKGEEGRSPRNWWKSLLQRRWPFRQLYITAATSPSRSEEQGGTEQVQLWAGLGNPGAQYALHRHNVGFMAADTIAEVHGFGPWQKKFRSLIAEGRIGGTKVLLLKPQTYMNDSGDAVQQALRFYKLTVEELTVFHDELDLAPMKVKVRIGGGLAGHNGLRSINAALGPDFRRVRIGIGHPGHKDKVTPHVLGNYAKSEMEPLSDLLAALAAEASRLASGEDARFMSDVALRLQQEG
jgi:PTH1 family peptidyl-tRNA hydrolase